MKYLWQCLLTHRRKKKKNIKKRTAPVWCFSPGIKVAAPGQMKQCGLLITVEEVDKGRTFLGEAQKEPLQCYLSIPLMRNFGGCQRLSEIT